MPSQMNIRYSQLISSYKFLTIFEYFINNEENKREIINLSTAHSQLGCDC